MIDVSVIIPTLNGGTQLAEQIRALANQRCRDVSWEVVVSDNGSSDGSGIVAVELARSLGLLARYVDSGRKRGINVARNLAVEAVRSELILFCDADDEVAQDWLQSLTDSLRECDIAGGVLRLDRINDPIALVGQAPSRGPLFVTDYVVSPVGASLAFRRVVWEEVGGFDESYTTGWDEFDFVYRARNRGFSVAGCEKAVVDYRLRAGLKALAKQQYRYGKGEGLFRGKHSLGAEMSDLRRDVHEVFRRVANLRRFRSEAFSTLFGRVCYSAGLFVCHPAIRRPVPFERVV